MQRIQGARVLVSGLQGLGAEVAKNLVLMGVGSLTLHDPHPTCWSDLAAQVSVLGGCGLPDQGGGMAQEDSCLCSGCTGSLPSFSSQSGTWKGAELRPLKSSWLSSTELSRSLCTRVTSLRTCCWTSRSAQACSPQEQEGLGSGFSPADHSVHPGGGADCCEAGGAAEGGYLVP